jgi:Glucodextranase, domain N
MRMIDETTRPEPDAPGSAGIPPTWTSSAKDLVGTGLGSRPWAGTAAARCSAGYVGFSDGWQDFAANERMAWTHERTGPGNVALLGELERECVRREVLARNLQERRK